MLLMIIVVNDITRHRKDSLRAAGYRVTVAAVYADRDVCEARGARRQADGKRYSGKNWRASVEAIFRMQAHLAASAAPAAADAAGPALEVLRESHLSRHYLSNAGCSSSSGEECSKSWCSSTRRNTHKKQMRPY